MRSIVAPLELTVWLVADETVVECSAILEPAILNEFHDGVEPAFKHLARCCGHDLRNTFCVRSLAVYASFKFYAALAFVNDDLMEGVAFKIGVRYF